MNQSLRDLPPLRDVVAGLGLTARRALGQNFLFDLNLTRRIARAGGPLEGTHVIEVGPGPGGLTRALLLEGAAHVTVIERDSRALPALEEIASAAPDRLSIIAADALRVDWRQFADGRPTRIVSNLPYNIGTALLVGWLTDDRWPPFWQSLTLMFQREVADRIVASAGKSAYGRLSVLADWRTRPVRLFDVPPSAFTPQPRVTSAVVRLEPRAEADDISPSAVAAVTAAAFGQRRKMMRSSLKSLWPDPGPILAEIGIDPTARAETVPVAGFLQLARSWASGRR